FPPDIGEERPVRADAAAVFIGFGDIVRADCDQPAIPHLELTMKLNEPFMLPAVLGAVTSATENENHWILFLKFRELPALRGVIGKLVIGEHSSWKNVGSHIQSLEG